MFTSITPLDRKEILVAPPDRLPEQEPDLHPFDIPRIIHQAFDIVGPPSKLLEGLGGDGHPCQISGRIHLEFRQGRPQKPELSHRNVSKNLPMEFLGGGSHLKEGSRDLVGTR